MPAEPKPAPTERGASDEAEREEMTIEIEDGDAEAKKAGQTAEETKAAEAEQEQGAPAAEEAEDAKAEAGSEEPAEAEAAPETDAAAKLQEELAKAQADAKEWQDKFMRLHAEWDTYRRRTAEQREAEKARAAEKLVTSLLPVIDDFERTIDYATKNGEGGLFDGVKAVHAKLVDVLKKDGVEVIDPAGEAFDALEAQAVATVDDASVPDETVSEVYQRGYKMGTKVLRPAMVTVTSGGPKREKPQEDAEK